MLLSFFFKVSFCRVKPQNQIKKKEVGGWGVGGGIPARLLPRMVQAGSAGGRREEQRFVVGGGGGGGAALRPVAPKHLPRPPKGPSNATTSRSLVNEQPAHPAELAGKPPPEGTKVLVMELLEFGGPADVA